MAKKKDSSNPVERAEAELEEIMDDFNSLIGQAPEPSADTNPLQIQDPEPQDTHEPEPQPAADGESYKHRWESLQGIVKSKDTQIASLTSQIDQLVAQNSQILQQVQLAQSAPKQTQPADTSDVSADSLMALAGNIKETYGDSLGEVFEKIAKHIQRLEDGGKHFYSKLSEVTTQLSASQAEERLSMLCPTWRQVDKDQGFISWLNRPAPYTNTTMLDLLNTKWRNGELDTVASIFNEYIGMKQQPSPPAADPRSSLVTPGSSSVGSRTQQQPQQKIWTTAEVNSFMRSIQAKTFRGSAADAQRIEDEISQAYLEDRVR